LGDFLQKVARKKATQVAENNGVAKSTLKVFGEAFYKKLRRGRLFTKSRKKKATQVAKKRQQKFNHTLKFILKLFK
jgi:hypothetical protein